MNISQIISKISNYITSIVLLFLFIGCSTAMEKTKQLPKHSGQFSLFLNGPDSASLDITFTLQSISIASENGSYIELLDFSKSINSLSVIHSQIGLAESVLPEGRYNKIRLIIGEAIIKKKNRVAHLALPTEGIEIPINIVIKQKGNISVFLNWLVDSSITDNYLFKPVLTVKKQTLELRSFLIYVTNESSNNVSVINRHTGEIVTNIMVGDKPRGIAASYNEERSKIYVANSGSDSISIIDPTTQKVENEIPVRFGKEPVGITVAKLSPSSELIFVTNFISNSVSVIDPTTFQETEKINVGHGPVAVAAEPPVEDLIGTRFLSFDNIAALKSYRDRFINVYVVNQNSNDVSVLRIDKTSKKLNKITTLEVDWNPKAVSIDYPRGKVYIANYGSDKLSVIDILQLIRGNDSSAVSAINNVGHKIIDIIADPAFDRLYLLKQFPAKIEILKPFESSFDNLKSVMPPVMGSITVGDSPRSFIMDNETRMIYVVNQESNNISVVDKTAKSLDHEIPVGSMPYGIALFRQ
jgi:YVTN family beta-propeller protein